MKSIFNYYKYDCVSIDSFVANGTVKTRWHGYIVDKSSDF